MPRGCVDYFKPGEILNSENFRRYFQERMGAENSAFWRVYAKYLIIPQEREPGTRKACDVATEEKDVPGVPDGHGCGI